MATAGQPRVTLAHGQRKWKPAIICDEKIDEIIN